MACGSDELYGGTAVSKDIFAVELVAEDGCCVGVVSRQSSWT